YGEFLIGGAFIAFFTVMNRWQLNPLLSLFASVPIAFVLNWLIYRLLMVPLVRRAPDQDALDADVVLVTFGLFFVLQGLALVGWSGDLRGYSFLAEGRNVFGAVVALNRLLAFLGACVLALALFLILRHTRVGAALRAITIDPVAAELMGVDVRKFSAIAFAAGGALAATAGMLVSTFNSFSATSGGDYTLKALIVVIMAGVGRVTGTLAAGLLLGVVEQMGGYLLDPGLTLAINFGLFTLILLLRPTGLFTRA
ncbi:MAG TPA: branched-chain amino acid ABC transporter permease, partial [Hyphomicrobiaceae bacterium]|nr:branched-chain amino acid ABC transporter permease [Hyphomicrobiaceae bacterium]